MTYGVGTWAWIPIWWIPTLCPCSLHFSAASRWRKESREVFVEQTHYMCLKSGPCRNHVLYIQISCWRVNFRRRVKMGTSIHPQSPQTQSLQFSMEKKKKKQFRKEKGLAGWGTLSSLLDSNLERNAGWWDAEGALGLQSEDMDSNDMLEGYK